MSVFSGTYGKGAMRQHRDKRYQEAVSRQLILLNIGTYIRKDYFGPGLDIIAFPAPIEKFLRVGDAVNAAGVLYTLPKQEVKDEDRSADPSSADVQVARSNASANKHGRHKAT